MLFRTMYANSRVGCWNSLNCLHLPCYAKRLAFIVITTAYSYFDAVKWLITSSFQSKQVGRFTSITSTLLGTNSLYSADGPLNSEQARKEIGFFSEISFVFQMFCYSSGSSVCVLLHVLRLISNSFNIRSAIVQRPSRHAVPIPCCQLVSSWSVDVGLFRIQVSKHED